MPLKPAQRCCSAVTIRHGTRPQAGLASMVAASLWALLSPANKRCEPDGCELPAAKL